jgi:hypothetical protein
MATVDQLADVEQHPLLLLGNVAHQPFLQEALAPEERVVGAEREPELVTQRGGGGRWARLRTAWLGE